MSKSVDVWYIYVLRDPKGSEVRYVGWCVNPQKRISGHRSESKSKDHHRARWLRKLSREGLEPIVEVIETGSGTSWSIREKYWIKHFRMKGARLTNSTDGGEGILGYRHTPEAKIKISIGHTGLKASAESLQRRQQYWSTPEAKALAASASLKGHLDPEVVLKRKKSLVAAWDKPGARQKRAIGQSNGWLNMTDEGRSKRLCGMRSPEARAKKGLSSSGEAHPKAKMTTIVVREIRSEVESCMKTSGKLPHGFFSEWSRKLGVDKTTLRRAALGITWTHL